MSIVFGKMRNKFLMLMLTLLICSNAYAADVNLSEIEFSTANQGFNVVLKTDKNTTFKKTIQNPQKLIIEMKNTLPSENFSTIYNDVADINNVTITPVGKDDLKIQIQGKNVNNSFISIDSASTSTIVQNFDSNQINLSLPIENYKPVYNEIDIDEEEIEEEYTISEAITKLNPLTMFNKNASNISNHKKQTSNKDFKWLTYLGLGIIMFSAVRNLTKATKTAQIGLTSNIKDREKELADKLNSSVKETLSLRSKISNNASAPSINYGLKAYQNSQKNPYENGTNSIRPVRKIEVSSQVSSEVKPQSASVPTTLKSPVKTQQRRTATRPISSITSNYRETSSVDSKKFLEAMTKIYEKNGRTDLAQGLKNNINKVTF